jgi:carbon-monoxide dehydrogenase medium subunit
MPAGDPEFLRPASVAEAVQLLTGGDATVMAGGTSVGLMVGQRLIEPERLVWIGGIDELAHITEVADGVRIGAGVTLREMGRHPAVRAAAPAVAAAAASVGNPRIRAVATLGGALAHADPRQDLPPALAACGAVAEIAGPDGIRRVPVAELATGFLETVLAPDELLTAVIVPAGGRRHSVYLRYTPGSVADFPTVGAAAAAVWPEVGDRPVSVSLVLGGVASTPLVIPEASELAGAADPQEHVAAVAAAARSRAEPVSDRLGSAAYKREMAAVWAARALTACLAPARADPKRRPTVQH